MNSSHGMPRAIRSDPNDSETGASFELPINLLTSAPCLIAFVADANGTIVFATHAARNVFGLSTRDYSTYSEARPFLLDVLRRSKGQSHIAHEVTGADGITRHLLVNHSDIPQADDHYLTMVTATDVSLFLAHATNTAEASKQRFLANVSHELRTPLNAVIGFAELLMYQAEQSPDPQSADPNRSYIKDIHGAGRHLLGMIEDLLELSSLDRREIRLREASFELRTMIEEAVDAVHDDANDKGVRFNVANEKPVSVLGDRDRLKRALSAVLSNATKFSPPGGVVDVHLEIRDTMSIVVSDAGPGMSESEIKLLQKPFAQAAEISTRSHGGAGLGLPLVRGIIHLHDGEISIASQPGFGTTVRLTLPESRFAPVVPPPDMANDAHL